MQFGQILAARESVSRVVARALGSMNERPRPIKTAASLPKPPFV